MLIKGLNQDMMKNIFTYLPTVPKDGTTDRREYDEWLKTDEGKHWNNQCGEYKSVNRNDVQCLFKAGKYKDYENGRWKILHWFINEKGDLDNRYIFMKKCCIKCKKQLPENTEDWKTKCYSCWKSEKKCNVCLFD